MLVASRICPISVEPFGRWMLLRAACSLSLLIGSTLTAQAQVPPLQGAIDEVNSPAPNNSNLDGTLFFQLLVGEIQWRSGEQSAAFDLMLDAARRTKNEQLFRRATEMAIQAKMGDKALATARSWRVALPGSIDAHLYVVNILAALNRAHEMVEPLRSLIEVSPPQRRSEWIQAMPRFFSRHSDRQAAARWLEETLESYAQAPATRTDSRVAIARGWFNAQDKVRSLALLNDAHTRDPQSPAPAMLAIEMASQIPQAEEIVKHYLELNPQNNEVRLFYARVLRWSQRFADAVLQFEILTRTAPNIPGPWLSLGALRLELRQPLEARQALATYLERFSASELSQSAEPAPQANQEQELPSEGLNEARLLLAQAAEQLKDFKTAESWLSKVDDPERASMVIQRRAALWVQQGLVNEALQLVRQLPETDETSAKTRLSAQSQVLRDAKRWKEAFAVLQAGSERFPDDASILYEQSMVAEKLGLFDDMERLLRQVMELKPGNHHAHNALGYSLADRNLRLPEAKALIQRALELAPGDPLVTDSLAWAEYRIGNHAEATRLLRWAYSARPDIEVGAHLGEVLWVQGLHDEARRIWREVLARDQDNEVLRDTLTRLRVGL